MVYSPNEAVIDLSALIFNLRQVKALVGPETKIMGIVKSDAYGHGLLQASESLEREGIHYLGVAHTREAMALRREGVKAPIVILSGIRSRGEAAQAVDSNLTPVIFDLGMAESLNREADQRGKQVGIQLKVDTGMGRLGLTMNEIPRFIERLFEFRALLLEGLTSHLSSADEADEDYTRFQIENFKKSIETVRGKGLALPLNNLANSAGIMRYKASHFDMVRPGIMLYGGLPSPDFKSPVKLKPAMHFRGQVLQVRDLPDNSPVSYGRTYLTKGTRKLAVVSAGYGDGLPRSLSNRGKVLIGGKKVPIVGRVCMNMTLCDVTSLKEVTSGREAVFMGSQGNELILGDHLAGWGETISYEIFCSIGQRNHRRYIPWKND
jgi:alanine racemase